MPGVLVFSSLRVSGWAMDSTSWLRGRAVRAAPAHLRCGATVIRCSDGRLRAPSATVADIRLQLGAVEEQARSVTVVRYPTSTHERVDTTLRTGEKRCCSIDIDEPRDLRCVLLRQQRRDPLGQLIKQLIADPERHLRTAHRRSLPTTSISSPSRALTIASRLRHRHTSLRAFRPTTAPHPHQLNPPNPSRNPSVNHNPSTPPSPFP